MMGAPMMMGAPVNATKQLELETKLTCFNQEVPGSPAFEAYAKSYPQCKDKWLSSAEKLEVEKQLDIEKAKTNVAVIAHMLDPPNLPSYLMNVWMEMAPNLVMLSNGHTMMQLNHCLTAHSAGSAEYKQQLDGAPSVCQGKLIPEAEAPAMWKEAVKKGAPVYNKAARMNGYFKDLYAKNPRARVFTAAQQVKCFASNDSSPAAEAIHRAANESSCAGFGIRPASELLAHKDRILAEMKKLIPDLDRWAKKQDEAEAKASDEFNRLHPEKAINYGTRRLLARYKSEANPAGSPAGLHRFCEKYEAEQRRDIAFAKAGMILLPFDNETLWKLAEANGFTEAEISAIRSYTGAFYGEVNRALWDEKAGTPLEPGLRAYQTVMLPALGKIQSYQGAVKRFSELPAKVLAEHQVGSVVTYDAYTSTSFDPNWAWQGGANSTPNGFLIYAAKRGKSVANISTSPAEKEVLFAPGTRFKVLSRKERETRPGTFDFVMAEVDEAGNVIADIPAAKGAK